METVTGTGRCDRCLSPAIVALYPGGRKGCVLLCEACLRRHWEYLDRDPAARTWPLVPLAPARFYRVFPLLWHTVDSVLAEAAELLFWEAEEQRAASGREGV